MARQLKPEEYSLLKFMLDQSGHPELAGELDSAIVNDMADGGMGSLRFVGSKLAMMGNVLCEAQTIDSDNVPLEISINADKEGRLFELDIWKVNFAPVQTYPSPSALKLTNQKR